MTPGDFFAIPGGHDSWVIGDERYVSLHLLGADAYAAPTQKHMQGQAVRRASACNLR